MNQPRYPVVIGLKLSSELAAEIRRLAREDDRTVSGYLRRVLGAVVQEQDREPQSGGQDVVRPGGDER